MSRNIREAHLALLREREHCRDYIENAVRSPLVFDPASSFYPGHAYDEDTEIMTRVSPVHLRHIEGTRLTQRSELYPVALIPREEGVCVSCRAYDERRHALARRSIEVPVDSLADPEELLSFIQLVSNLS